MKPLEDTDPMPFGKHKGEMMQDVPASYLHWLWIDNIEKNPNAVIYIPTEANLPILEAGKNRLPSK